MSSRRYVTPFVDASATIQNPDRRRLMQTALMGSAALVAAPLFASPGLVDQFGEPFNDAASNESSDDAIAVLRDALLAGLNLVPVVGGLLSYLGGLFIPSVGKSPEQQWREYTDQRISATLFNLVRADLLGLTGVSMLYRDAIRSGDMIAIRTKSIAANTSFTAAIPRFSLPGHEIALLPLYVVAASLHLALLRDMALKATELGLTRAYQQTLENQARACIAAYTGHVDRYVAAAVEKARVDNPYDWRKDGLYEPNKPLTQMLQVKTALQLSAVDMRDTWYAFDPVKYPSRVPVRLSREVHSPIIGIWDRRNIAADSLPDWPAPADDIQVIRLKQASTAGNARWILGIRVEYHRGMVLETGNWRGTGGKALHLTPSQKITEVRTWFSHGISRIELHSNRPVFSEGAEPSDRRHYQATSYPGHHLTSMRSIGSGIAPALGMVRSMICGFQLSNQMARPINLRTYDELAPKIAPQLLDWIAR